MIQDKVEKIYKIISGQSLEGLPFLIKAEKFIFDRYSILNANMIIFQLKNIGLSDTEIENIRKIYSSLLKSKMQKFLREHINKGREYKQKEKLDKIESSFGIYTIANLSSGMYKAFISEIEIEFKNKLMKDKTE